jgi:tRNA1(Val) A37 N6-methylase TrmN6
VGCGTGALSRAILDRCNPTAVDAVEPLPASFAQRSNASAIAALRRRLLTTCLCVMVRLTSSFRGSC